jgi:hypothetical protein
MGVNLWGSRSLYEIPVNLTAHRAGLLYNLKQLQLFWHFFLFSVVIDIFPGYFCGYLVTYGPDKVSIFPKFTTPQLLFFLCCLLP